MKETTTTKLLEHSEANPDALLQVKHLTILYQILDYKRHGYGVNYVKLVALLKIAPESR